MPKAKVNLVKSYMDYVAEHGKRPATVFSFCKAHKIEEADFYKEYASFDSLEKETFHHLFKGTVEQIESEEVYLEYSARERFLAFSFTLIEEMKKNLTYYRQVLKHYDVKESLKSPIVKAVKHQKDFFEKILQHGTDTGEITERQFLNKALVKSFEGQTLLIVSYFLKDDSQAFSDTDKFIEKSVRLHFDTLENTVIDSAIDLAKFLGRKLTS